MAIKRQVGERSTVATPSYRGSDPGNLGVDIGYSAPNVQAVDIGQPNPYMEKKTPLNKLAPLYGGAGPSKD